MQRDDPTGHRPGGPAPGGPGADTVLAALAHRLRARSERQQLLTERLRSGELRPGALADLAELAAAARRGVRDGDHILVMAGAELPDRAGGGGPVSLGQALSAAVAASEAASRTVVPPTPSVSLGPAAGPVFGQILAELLAHATAATAPGERLELHTRWGPDGGLVLELLSPRPVPTRTPVDELDRMLAAGRPDGPVAPQEIGLYVAARLARAIGGRLGVRGSPGVASAPGPSPVAVLQLPPSALAGSRSSTGEELEARPAAEPPHGTPDGPAAATGAGALDEPPTGVVASASAVPPAASPPPAAAPADAPAAQADRDPSVRPWPPTPVSDAGPLGGASNGMAPEPGPSGEPQDAPSGPGPIARIPVPPEPSSPPQSPLPSAPPSAPEHPAFPFPPAAHTGASDRGPQGLAGGRPEGPSGNGLQIPPGPRGPGAPGPGAGLPGRQPGPTQPGPHQTGPPPPGPGQHAPNRGGSTPPGPNRPVDDPPVTEAFPSAGITPPVELFGPFDSEVPVPVDDLDGTPIFAAVASAWFRDPATPPNGSASGGPPGTNGRRPSDEPVNWTSGGDAEFDAARSRADRVVEPSVNANGLPMRRPGQQMVPPARRDGPSPPRRTAAERQPDRVRNRLASYQRGLREGRHRAAEENSATTTDSAARNLNGAAPHGHNGHAAG